MLDKKITLFLILMMVIALSGALVLPTKAVVAPFELPSNPLCAGITGDLNGDGLINKYDTEVMRNMAKGLEPVSPCADLDLDGFVGPGDMSILTKIYKLDLPAHPEIVAELAELKAAADEAKSSAESSSISCTLGDANGDNMIDYKDQGLVTQMMKGELARTKAADLDGDGFIGPGDLSILISMIKFSHAESAEVTEEEKGNCDLPTVSVSYSLDGGETYASTITVKNGDTLTIKATFNKPLNRFEYAYLDIDNGLGADLFMVKNTDTESVYDLVINNPGNLTATVLVKTINGAFDENDIVLTDGATFKVVNFSFGGSTIRGGSNPVCEAVNYSDWSVCADGKSTRILISKVPSDCVPNSDQILEVEKTCTVETQTTGETLTEEQGVVLGEKYVSERDQQLAQIYDDAHYIWPGDTDLLLGYMNTGRNLILEQRMAARYGSLLGYNVRLALGGVETVNATAITNFLTYGTKTTLSLGASERAGILNSYKAAYNKLPKTEEEWRDLIKIGNGRWPSQISPMAEKRAAMNFKIVYKRNPNMKDTNDNAAVTIMAYGLRPLPRNLDSERIAIDIFIKIYGYMPVKATAWDVVRAIAYAGVKR